MIGIEGIERADVAIQRDRRRNLNRVELAARQSWLLDFVPASRQEWVLRNLVVGSIRLDRGPIGADDLPRAAFGLLVLDGLIVRRLTVRTYTGAELLAESDLVRPWTFEGEVSSIPATAAFHALTDVELAVLDQRFLQVAARVPELSVALVDRSVDRARMESFFLTVRAVVRIEERLLLTLWHLAERYGRVTPDGVLLRLPRVSHDLLGEMIGARRPSVTVAVNGLERRGLISRRGRGTWILSGEPHEALNRLDR